MNNPLHQTQNTGRNKFSLLFSLLSIGLLVLNTKLITPASAADISIVVSPPRTDIDLNPAETTQKTIKVTNAGTTELILAAQVFDFIVQDDSGTPIKVTEEASGRFLASPWFTLETDELVIPPKETTLLSLTITAPPDALPGGHYAGVYFEPKSRRGENKTVSYTNAQVGSLFAITVSGNLNYDALIKDFAPSNNLFEFGPVDFSLMVENQSDTHIRPQTTITIRDMLGRQLETLNLDTINIFPFSSRELSARWENIWGFGKYQATATIVYGSGLTTSRDTSFWIIPYRLIAAILVIILVLLATTISIKRHLLSRSDQRDAEIDALKRRIAEMENNLR